MLAATPFMFASEVTLFFDEDYFSTFLPPETSSRTVFDGGWIETAPSNGDLLSAILPTAPPGLKFRGGARMLQHDPEWTITPVESWTWVWAFDRR